MTEEWYDRFYERSVWAEHVGVWHDMHGRPWINERHDSTGIYDEIWYVWSDKTRSYTDVDLKEGGSLVVALLQIIDQLNDELLQVQEEQQ